jgi:tRNA C32,U32 (ribose-2'-O)-methylase TrmJ
MSLPILLTQLHVANVRTLAASVHIATNVVGVRFSASQPEPEGRGEDSATHADNQALPLAPWEVDWCEPVALLVGNEGAGLPEEVERSADARIRIPMSSGVESLNAAAAAAVLFYEAARQRTRQTETKR